MTHTREPLVIRPLQPHEWSTWREVRLRALADAPDAFGATLAEEQERIPEAWAARLSAAAVSGDDCPLIAETDGAAVGLVWAKVDATNPSLVNLFRMWVAPESRGRGVASGLLREAIGWAKRGQARVVQLGVTCGDTPAARLYVRAGFKNVGVPGPLRPGSPLLLQEMQLVIGDDPA